MRTLVRCLSTIYRERVSSCLPTSTCLHSTCTLIEAHPSWGLHVLKQSWGLPPCDICPKKNYFLPLSLIPNMDEKFLRNNFQMVGITLQDVEILQKTSCAQFSVENKGVFDWILNELKGRPLPLCPLKTFDVESAVPKNAHMLYVSNMSRQTDDYGLYLLFKERYPSVVKAIVQQAKFSQRAFFGLVQFTDPKERDRAVKEMNGLFLENRSTPLIVKLPYYDIMPSGGYTEPQFSTTNTPFSAQQSSSASEAVVASRLNEEEEESDDEEIDPNPLVDYDQVNKECFAQSEHCFLELERTRWQPIANVNSRLHSSKIREALSTVPVSSTSSS